MIHSFNNMNARYCPHCKRFIKYFYVYNFISFLKPFHEVGFISQFTKMRKIKIKYIQGFVHAHLALRMWKPFCFIFFYVHKHSYDMQDRTYIQILICAKFFPYLLSKRKAYLIPQGHFRYQRRNYLNFSFLKIHVHLLIDLFIP